MKIVFLISAFFLTQLIQGQESYYKLRFKASGFFVKNKQIDSALFYYQEISRKFPGMHSDFVYNRMAECHLRVGDTASAERSYLQSLAPMKKPDSAESWQTRSSYALSTIYYARRDFRKALNYLNYTQTIYKPLRQTCFGLGNSYEPQLLMAYEQARCYYGLNKKDSVISLLAPFIFRPRGYIDPVKSGQMSRFFVNTLFEVYGSDCVGGMLQAAVANIDYKLRYEHERGFIFLQAECHITFNTIKISLDSPGPVQVFKEGEVPEYLSKEALLNGFKSSLTYKYIMEEQGAGTYSHLQTIKSIF